MNYASSILGLLPGGRRAPGIGQLTSKIEAYLPAEQVERVREAFDYAETAHQGQKRRSGEAFIRVKPLRDPDALESTYFDVQACNDSNQVDLFVFANESQAVLIARLDNLGKGASGAAVQTMNIHLGLEEGYAL